jgi:methylphosphotriester-DNA--protein-cysteine methyltransferase
MQAPNDRHYDDEFVVNSYSNIFHRTYCKYARLMKNGWKHVASPKVARSQMAGPCWFCEPYEVLAGRSGILHFPKCIVTRRGKDTKSFFTVRDAYFAGFYPTHACTPEGVPEYIEKLERMLSDDA